MAPIKWVALASGEGTILDHMYSQGLKPDLVVTDRQCAAYRKAFWRGLDTVVWEKEGKFSPVTGCDAERTEYTLRLAKFLQFHNIKLGVMAEWETVFSPEFFANEFFAARLLNTHPSLLPSFKGHTAVADALAYGGKLTGYTIHLATEWLDDGPILSQASVPIWPSDDEAKLHERIKFQERRAYTEIVKMVLDGRLDLATNWSEWHEKHPHGTG